MSQDKKERRHSYGALHPGLLPPEQNQANCQKCGGSGQINHLGCLPSNTPGLGPVRWDSPGPCEDCSSTGRRDYETELAQLRAQLAEAEKQRDDYKRIADRNHRANLIPCPECGYKPAVIKAKESQP